MKRFNIEDDNTGHKLFIERRSNGDVAVSVLNSGGSYTIGRVVVPDSETATLLDVLRAE